MTNAIIGTGLVGTTLARFFASKGIPVLLANSCGPETLRRPPAKIGPRVQRAFELLRDRRHGLAYIAAATGFADRSHLSRWVRRVHGVSPTELTAEQYIRDTRS